MGKGGGMQQEAVLHPASIISELTGQKIDKLIGLFPHKLTLEPSDDKNEQDAKTLDVMVKVKPLDQEVILMTNTIASMCSPRLNPFSIAAKVF